MAEKGYEAYLYDHTVERLPQEHPNCFFQRRGLAGVRDDAHPELATLPALMAENGHQDCQNLVLKMDIEGAEVGVFTHLPEQVQNQFAQIVLELHGFDHETQWEGLAATLECINRTHQLVHLHANNCGQLLYMGDMVVPNAYEATYVRKADFEFEDVNGLLLTDADYRCDGNVPEWMTWQP